MTQLSLFVNDAFSRVLTTPLCAAWPINLAECIVFIFPLLVVSAIKPLFLTALTFITLSPTGGLCILLAQAWDFHLAPGCHLVEGSESRGTVRFIILWESGLATSVGFFVQARR